MGACYASRTVLTGPRPSAKRIADHLTRLLDKLGLDHVPQKPVGQVVVYMPDNGRDPLLRRPANGQDPTGSPAPDSPKGIATVELPPRDNVIIPNKNRRVADEIERLFGLR